MSLCAASVGALDHGPTFARRTVEIAATHVVGAVLDATAKILAGDPLAHLELTPASLARATTRLRAIADRHAGGRLLVLGGGGYEKANLAAGWCAVVEALL